MKRYGPKAPTTIHGPLEIKYHPKDKANASADCLEKQSTSHDLCDADYERQVEARVQALLPSEDTPLRKLRPCDIQKLVNYLKLRNIVNLMVFQTNASGTFHGDYWYMTHLFNHCPRLSHFSKPWKEAKIITLPVRAQNSLKIYVSLASCPQ
jgi:hypothetical protein